MAMFYSREHQWIDLDGSGACPVGITAHAQETLGDIVFVELPAIGKTFAAGEVAAVVESVKAASDVFMPVGGEVVAVNTALQVEPALANSSPLGDGWFFKIRPSDGTRTAGLLDEAAYKRLVAGESGN